MHVDLAAAHPKMVLHCLPYKTMLVTNPEKLQIKPLSVCLLMGEVSIFITAQKGLTTGTGFTAFPSATVKGTHIFS